MYPPIGGIRSGAQLAHTEGDAIPISPGSGFDLWSVLVRRLPIAQHSRVLLSILDGVRPRRDRGDCHRPLNPESHRSAWGTPRAACRDAGYRLHGDFRPVARVARMNNTAGREPSVRGKIIAA